ncbi:MAG: prephenate dehydrogenase/arogenate dehydrogenase family protein [Pseudomonadota bacterium]
MSKTVAIIGVGLIGGSLARALRKNDWCESLIGFDSDDNALTNAQQLNVIDQGFSSFSECEQIPEVIVIATPVLTVGRVCEQIKSWFNHAKVVTDVASTKQSVINDVKEAFDGQLPDNFVPGHPIAGLEKKGVSASKPDLFETRKVILTPEERTSRESLAMVTEMWTQAGANVEIMNAKVHDKILASTSHLPHAIAFSLVYCLAKESHTEEIFRYAAGGFADFSRIASSDPVLWKQICLANRDELLIAIKQFEGCLNELHASLENNDGDRLQEIFLDAKNTRDRFV